MDSYGDKFQAIPNHDNSRYRISKVKEGKVESIDKDDIQLEALNEKIGIMLADIARIGVIGEDDYCGMNGKLSLKYMYKESFA